MKKLLFGFLISLFLIQSAYSAVPNSFTNDTVADADEVNENFTYFENKFSTTSGHDHDNSDSKLLTTLSTITSGEWRGTILDEPYGGTGKGSYASGDLLYATADIHLAKLSKPALLGTILLFSSINSTPEWLAAGSTGDVLRSNGIQTNPYWTNELPASLITSGTLGTARLGSGTASSNTFLRGDSTWVANGYVNAAQYYEPDGTCIVAFNNMSNTVADLSPVRNVITLTSLADADLVAGKINKLCYDFDGTNDYAVIPDHASQSGSSAISFEVWVYKDVTGDMFIFDNVTDSYLDLEMDDTNILWTIATSSGNETGSIAHGLASSGTGAWVYIVVAWDNTGASTLYVNGSSVGNGNDAGNGTVSNSANGINIGARNDAGLKWNGKIDGLRILRRKMGATEVSARYTAFN